MRPFPVTVAVKAQFPLDEAGLTMVISGLPGLAVVPPDAVPPPRVFVWDTGSSDLNDLSGHAVETALLLIVGSMTRPHMPPGAAGLFSREESPEALGAALRQVARGEQYLSPSLAPAILETRETEVPSAATDLSTLTEREREMLSLLAEGLSNKTIAARLYLSVRTVEGHLAGLYSRLGVHSRTEAALITIQSGLGSQTR